MDWQKIIVQLKNEVEKYKIEADQAKSELAEHLEFSREVEAELDKELETANIALAKRDKEVASLIKDRDKYKEEANRLRSEMCTSDNRNLEELEKLRSERERLLKKLHNLEQRNDDLERELRIKIESLKDTEKKLNEQLESHALLITDMDKKDEYKMQCRRLEEELRDWKMDYQKLEEDFRNLKIENGLKDGMIRNRGRSEKNGLPTGEDVMESHKNGITKFAPLGTDGSIRPYAKGEFETRMAAHLGALPAPLARNLSPIVANLINTIQNLESKLLSLPERPVRENRENGIGSTITRH